MVLRESDLRLWYLPSLINLKPLKPRAHLLRTLKRSLKPSPLKSWTPRLYLVDGPSTRMVTFSSQINLWISGKFVLGVSFDTTFDLVLCSTRSRIRTPDALRVTVAKLSDGKVEIVADDGTSQKAYPKTWVGMTIYQISGAARKELCMHVSLPVKKIAKYVRGKFNRVQKKVDKGGVSERHLSLDEKLQFQNAKQKELRSFFQNQVWQFDTTANADPSRTMTARMLLKWSKNEDGSPRAKARLIARGYADVDALQGSLETSSPTTTRLSRRYLLSLTSMLGWKLWTSDIATAFLQGLPQERKLWVKLPSECLRLLGAPEETRMLLVKPVYGQLDAPRRWYLEAVRRLGSLGLRQHILDPCAFLTYETDLEDPYKPGTCRSSTLGDDRLCGMICLHTSMTSWCWRR